MNYFIKGLLKKSYKYIESKEKNKFKPLDEKQYAEEVYDLVEENTKGNIHCKEDIDEDLQDDKFLSEEDFRRSCCHEAGHSLIASLYDVDFDEIVISPTGSFVALNIDGGVSVSDLRNLISIMYGGILAEKLIFGEGSDGFMGSEDADMETANDYLREYVILSDKELSLTGLEEELIKKKMIATSIKIEHDTYKLLSNHKEELLSSMNKIIEDNKSLLSC